MYEKILHQAKLRQERQQRSVIETEAYLDALNNIPGSAHTVSTVRAKLLRQREALKRTTAEIEQLRNLINAGDPAQIKIDEEIKQNEKAALERLTKGRK